jgi:hypothetical protein
VALGYKRVETPTQQFLPALCPTVYLYLFLSLKIRSSIFSLDGCRENEALWQVAEFGWMVLHY